MSNLSYKQHTKKWHAIKKKFFGANDVASILNCGFNDQCDVIKRKISGEEQVFTPESIERMHKGTLCESIVRDLCSARIGKKIIDTGLKFHRKWSFITASPDGMTTNLNGEKMLTEFKVRSVLSNELKFKYWIQMQVQMEVWDINSCIYCENKIHYYSNESEMLLDKTALPGEIGSRGEILDDGVKVFWKLEDYNQFIVDRDRSWFNNIFPRIEKIWNIIEVGRSKKQVSTRSNRKRRHSETEAGTELVERMNYINKKPRLKYPADVNNTVLQDQLLDWLKLYGTGMTKDKARGEFDFVRYIYQQTVKFRIVCQNYIKNKYPETIDVESGCYPVQKCDYTIKYDFNYQYWDRIKKTNSLMKQKTPIILNAGLFDSDLNIYGKADMLVHKDFLYKFVTPEEQENVPEYYIFSMKFSTLNLRVNGKHLLSNTKQNIYKAHLSFLSMCLPGSGSKCYIIGRKSNMRKQKFNGAFDNIGEVDFETIDYNYTQLIKDALLWLTTLETQGNKWNINNPTDPEMFPNMKNKRDYPWHNLKNKLANKLNEITKMYSMGPRKRLFAQHRGITDWTKLTPSTIKTNGVQTIKRIANIIKANTEKTRVDMDLINFGTLNSVPKIEFFIDFESVNGVDDDFKQFPRATNNSMIYMIGCVVVNNETGKMDYRSYIVDRLKQSSEKDMIETWISDMTKLCPSGKFYCYHWSNAEKWMLERALDRNTYQGGKILLIDLCQEFQQSNCGIVGSFGYGLKDVAASLYKEGIIKTTWLDDMDGSQAMVAAWKAEEICKKKGCTFNEVPFMNDLVKYNVVDCKVLQEIVEFLRN
jgi:hypothetical protein